MPFAMGMANTNIVRTSLNTTSAVEFEFKLRNLMTFWKKKVSIPLPQ